MFSMFISVGSCHKVPPVPTNLSEPLWHYDSQKNGETFDFIFIHTILIKGRKKSSSFCLGYQNVIGNFFLSLSIFFFSKTIKLIYH